MKKYFITTYGCHANIADSENIAGMLEALGPGECCGGLNVIGSF